MTSPKGPRAKMVSANATNVDAPPSGSQSAPSEQVGGKDSTAESDTSEASQLDRANSSQGPDMTTASQTGTQGAASAKTLGNVGAPSSGSQSAPPEQPGSKDSITKSHSKSDVSKATPHALDSADPHSSGLNPTTVSQKETESTESVKTPANVGPGSSELPPAPPEHVEVENRAAEPHSEADTSKVSQPPQPSSGSGTTTEPQENLQRTESTKTPREVGAPSGDSQLAPPEQVGVKNPAAESRSDVDPSKASQHILDRENPSQSLDTTTGSQTGTQSAASAKTLENGGVPSKGSQSASKSHSKLDMSKATPHAFDSADPHSSGLNPTTVSQKETECTESVKTLVNVGPGSSVLPPASRENVGVEDSAAESHSEADTSKASQPPQPSSGPGTATKPQEDLQRTKTPGNVETPSGNSQLAASEQGVENSTTEFCSEAASQHALDGANPHQSSNGIDKTTNSQKELHTAGDERTKMNTADVGTLANSLNTQSTNGNMGVAPQGPRLSTSTTRFSASHGSEDVKDVTVSDQLPIHAGHSDHTNGEVMNQNEKSGNPSKPCEDASTSSIKLQENTEVKQPQQKEELRGTKDANKQKASGIAEDGQATTPSTKVDMKQRGDIGGLEAKIHNIQIVANQQAEEHKKEIERLETKITSLEKDRQRQEYKEEIESFNVRVSAMEALFFRMEHVSNMEHKKEIKRLEGKQERLEANLGHLETKVSSMEHAEHKQEIEYLKGKYEEEIQRLEGVVASMSEKASKLEKEIGRLQLKVSDAKQPKKKQEQDPPKSPDERPQATKHSSTAANQKINRSAQQPGVKKEPLQIASPSIKQTSISSPLAVVPKADTLSVTDVGNLVKALNSEIGQTVILLTESLSNLEEPPTSENESEIDFDELRNYLGPGLCSKLEGKSEIDPLITQLALQMGLVNACSSVVNDSPLLHSGSILQTLYSRMAEKEGQAGADEWKAKAFNYLDLPQCEDANKKYLTEVLLKLTIAAGGTLKSSKSLLSQYNQQVQMIAKSAAKLHKTITEDVRSSELITFTISCDTEFDASQMEDSENKGSTPHGKVICTQEMGLRCRKRVEPQNGPLKDWGVTTKAKVVLASTLD